MATLASAWCAESPEDAARWADSRLSDYEGGEIVYSLVEVWGEQDPVAASKWVMTLNEEHQTDAAATLISVWGASQPEVAAEWVSRFPSGDTRSNEIPALAEYWAESEPVKAMEWSLSLPDSDEKNEAVEAAISVWGYNSPAQMSEWLAKRAPGPETDQLRKLAEEYAGE